MYLLAAHNTGQGNLKSLGWDINKTAFETRNLINRVMTVYDHFSYLERRENHEKINHLISKKSDFVVSKP